MTTLRRDVASLRHGGRVYDYALESGIPLADVLDFSANINPLGPPDSVMVAIQASLDGIRHYPDASARQVKQVLAANCGVEVTQVLCGNGASEVIDLLFRTIRPIRTFVLEPSFSEYAIAARRSGSSVVSIDMHVESEFSLPFDEINRQVHAEDLVVINNPHNPSGRAWERTNWVEAVAQWRAQGVYVLMDESFMDFLPDASRYSAQPDVADLDHLVVVRSATKMYAIPGLRFGFAIGPIQLIAQIEDERDGWSVNHLAQVAATAAYQDMEYVQRTWAWLVTAQHQLSDWWHARPELDFFPPIANYFLVRFHEEKTSEHVQSGLRQQGIFVRNCSDFGGGLDGRYVRIAIRSNEENERLQQAVSTLLCNTG